MIFGGHAENYPGTASYILCSNCVYLGLQNILMLNACQLNTTQYLLVQADSEIVREITFTIKVLLSALFYEIWKRLLLLHRAAHNHIRLIMYDLCHWAVIYGTNCVEDQAVLMRTITRLGTNDNRVIDVIGKQLIAESMVFENYDTCGLKSMIRLDGKFHELFSLGSQMLGEVNWG